MATEVDFVGWGMGTLSTAIVLASMAGVSVLAFKVKFSFDLNRHIEGRHERKEFKRRERLQRQCPHVEYDRVRISAGSGEIAHVGDEQVQQLFPNGAHVHCRICGCGPFDQNEQQRILSHWRTHPRECAERLHTTNKLLKKSGRPSLRMFGQDEKQCRKTHLSKRIGHWRNQVLKLRKNA